MIQKEGMRRVEMIPRFLASVFRWKMGGYSLK